MSTDTNCNCGVCACTNIAFADEGDEEPCCDECSMGIHEDDRQDDGA